MQAPQEPIIQAPQEPIMQAPQEPIMQTLQEPTQEPAPQEPTQQPAVPNQKKVSRCGNCKEPGHKKAKCPMPPAEPEPDAPIIVSDIGLWSTGTTRSENDAANKIRERIFEMLANGLMPETFTTDAVYGASWLALAEEVKNTIQMIVSVPTYTNYRVKLLAGRKNNHDFDIDFICLDGTTVVAKRELEFKFGAKSVDKLPQFLSLTAKTDLFDVPYPVYYYHNFIDAYLATDEGLAAVPKPTLTDYLDHVFTTNYDVTPFIALLKAREEIAKPAKKKVVNASIKAYLETHGREIKLDQFKEKLVAQNGKVYMLYEPQTKKFHLEKIEHGKTEFNVNDTFVRKGNVLEIPAGDMQYGMLLRWRNHKGILMPAWQISLKMLKLIK